MSLFRQVSRGLRALLHARREDAEVAEEVRHYLDEATEAYRARGLDPEAARRAALVEVGSVSSVREEVRTSGWEHRLETVLLDLRYAVRRLRRSPVFTGTAAVTLALGLGASTAVFSVVRPILLEPLPFPEADRLVTVDDRTDDGSPEPATFGTYAEVRVRSRSFDRLAAADRWQPSLTGAGDPERLEGERVTAGYFTVFGAVPIAGRGFTAADDRPGAPNVAILSDALATRRFGGARAIVGREIDLNGDPYLVVGVMPHGFADVIAPTAEVWSPLRERATGDFNGREWGHHYRLVGRLAESTTIAEAREELHALGRTPVAEFPRPRWAAFQDGLLIRPLQEAIATDARPALVAIMAAVSLLLAIAVVNVSNLLLARAAQHRAEFAMRLALGASRTRFLRQLLTESLVLALLGGGLGLGVAELSLKALVAVSPPGLPRVEAIRLDAPVFAFAAAITALVGVLVGLAPALGALRAGLAERLQGSSRRATAGSGGARSALVLAEVALALVLLVSAGLLLRSVRHLMAVTPGIDPTNVMTMQVVEAGHGFDADPARLQFYDQALEAVRRVPGVTGAAFTSQLPLSGEVDGYGYEAEALPSAKPGENGSALRYAVTPDYFRTMGIPLRAGRLLEPGDRPESPRVVVLSEHFARRLFGGRDPIGQRMRFGPEVGASRPWVEVVGVVGDVKHYSLAVDAPDAFYVPNGQWAWADNVATLVVRAASRAPDLVPTLERAIWAVSRNVPIQLVRTMESYLTASAGNRRFALLAIETLAIAALLLAAVGLYGVISGSVSERTREIGIRCALGATSAEVVGQVVRRALSLTLAGVAIGLIGAYAAGRLIGSMLFGVSALDPLTYGGVVALLSSVALMAAWAPARRAAAVDPTIALKGD